jgi:glycosyltransferase involved in cell wall biosynthesis
MRILQLHTRYREAGGEDSVVRAEAALLDQAGHEVLSYVVDNPVGPLDTAVALAMSPWNPTAALKLRETASRLRPDVAHVHNTWYSLSPSVIAALDGLRIPVVMTLHNYRLLCVNGMLFRDGRVCEDCVGSHPWHGVQHRCYRRSAAASIPAAMTIALNRRRHTWDRQVQLFLTMTEFSRQRFIAGGLPPDRILVKPHFVADPGPRPAPPSASSTILFVGRLSREKGLDILLDALSATATQNLELIVVGDGPERLALERRAGPIVRFTGRLDSEKVRRLMLTARALVFPSQWYETFGMSIIEAMAAGLPVLASDLGGTAEVIGPRSGWLVPASDRAEWITALRGLCDGPTVDAAGRAARQRWQQRFSPTAGLSVLQDAYTIACGGRLKR